MNRQTLRRVSRQLRQNRQRGFTLIELLVVVSILGILAAIVTMSLVGITQMAQAHAKETEKQVVQTAYDTMLADQQVPTGAGCPAGPPKSPTDDMKNFPTSTAPGDTTRGQLAALSPNYLRTEKTHGTYQCTSNGRIVQVDYHAQ